MVLPEGFALPPLLQLGTLLLAFAGVVAVLVALEPPVTDRTVIAFAPWMAFGSTLHVLEAIEAVPSVVAPFFGAPTVYLTTAVVAGVAWIAGSLLYAAGLARSIARVVGTTGTGFFVVFAAFTLLSRRSVDAIDPLWPAIAIVATGVVTALAWLAIGLRATDVAATTGLTGAFVVFGHALDGVSTAVGYDVLGAGERVPLSQYILEAGAALPTAEYVGAGWLFVLVKVGLAALIVGLFAEYVRERPRRARVALGLVAAVGLGPGTYNLLLFTVT